MTISKEQNINVASIPYVTDGLIAHYDFLWNTRIRSYNSSSLIWKDLVGDNDIRTPADSAIWDDDQGLLIKKQFVGLQPMASSDQLTMEVCLFNIVGEDDRFVFTTNPSHYSNGLGVYIGNRNTGSRFGSSIGNAQFSYYQFSEIKTDESLIGTVSVRCDRNVIHNNISGWNGIEKKCICTWSTNPYIANVLPFGANFSATRTYFKRISFYDRLLTDDELIANYEVDIERFGI